MVSKSGFTLVEALLIVAIIAVLAAVAIPTYQKYVIRENRTNVQAAMVQISQKLAAYKVVNNNYDTTLSNTAIYGAAVYPQTGRVLYDLSLDTSTVAGGWTLTAAPRSGSTQNGNHNVVLNDQGQRCWQPTLDCTPSATSNWDNK